MNQRDNLVEYLECIAYIAHMQNNIKPTKFQ